MEIGEGVTCFVPIRSCGLGTLKIGIGCTIGFPLAPRIGNGEILLQPRLSDSEVEIGDGTHLSNNVAIIAKGSVTLGRNCDVGDQVAIFDSDFHEVNPKLRRTNGGMTKPVLIGNNVWLGSRCMILKGVTIGDNTVVGAMSLVTQSLPPNCIAAGVPAKILRMLE